MLSNKSREYSIKLPPTGEKSYQFAVLPKFTVCAVGCMLAVSGNVTAICTSKVSEVTPAIVGVGGSAEEGCTVGPIDCVYN